MGYQGVYAETLIRADVDEIWRRTQDPDLHQLWDLRFSEIRYLPRASESEPQNFHYSTRLGFGLKIEGEGQGTGSAKDATGQATSALRFWSADPKSLIEEGSGYWRYIPCEEGTRFLTWYEYRTRFGALGRLVDRLAFRPLLRWATAWSFDRLRLWIDRGVSPQTSTRLALIHAFARLGIAFTWLWQGLVPKLLFEHADEQAMMAAAGLSIGLLPVVGAVEVLLAAATLVLWRWRPFFLINVLLMLVALAAVAVQSSSYLVAAFNPVTLNVGMIVLSLTGYLAGAEIPSASHCRRQPRKDVA